MPKLLLLLLTSASADVTLVKKRPWLVGLQFWSQARYSDTGRLWSIWIWMARIGIRWCNCKLIHTLFCHSDTLYFIFLLVGPSSLTWNGERLTRCLLLQAGRITQNENSANLTNLVSGFRLGTNENCPYDILTVLFVNWYSYTLDSCFGWYSIYTLTSNDRLC